MIAPALSVRAAAGLGGPPVLALMRVLSQDVAIVAVVFGVLGVIAYPLARAFARRIEGARAAPALTPELRERLDRIERAVEAVALEVERISEGQRFVTRLMSERKEPALIPPTTTTRD